MSRNEPVARAHLAAGPHPPSSMGARHARIRPHVMPNGQGPEAGGSGLDFLNWEDCSIDEKKRLDRILYQNAWTRTCTPTSTTLSPGPEPAASVDPVSSVGRPVVDPPVTPASARPGSESQSGMYETGPPISVASSHAPNSMGPPGYPSYESLGSYESGSGDASQHGSGYAVGCSTEGPVPNIPVSNPPVSYAPYPNFIINNVTANVNVHPAPPTSVPLNNPNPSASVGPLEGSTAPPPVSMMVGSPGASYTMPPGMGHSGGALPPNASLAGAGVSNLMPNSYSPPMMPGTMYQMPGRPIIYAPYPSPQFVSVELAHTAGPMGYHPSSTHSSGPMGNAFGSPNVSHMSYYQQPPPVTQPITNRSPHGHHTNQYHPPPLHHHTNNQHHQSPMTSHLTSFSKSSVPLIQPHPSQLQSSYAYYSTQSQPPPQLQPHHQTAQPLPPVPTTSYLAPSAPPSLVPNPNSPLQVPPEVVQAPKEIHPAPSNQSEIPINSPNDIGANVKPLEVRDEPDVAALEISNKGGGDVEADEKPQVAREIPKSEPEIVVEKEEKDNNSCDAPSAVQPTQSWASLLFQNSGAETPPATKVALDKSVTSSEVAKPMARVQPYTSGQTNGEAKPSVEDHTLVGKMAHFFTNYTLNHKSLSVKPRGLTNHNNWCFTNAILQALVACPPFYNLMRALPMYEDPLPNQAANVVVDMSGVKILKSVSDFVNQFEVMTNFPKLNRSKSKKTEDLPLGKSFEASSIYNMLLNLNNDTFKVIEGRQEDAEEFLTFLLNGINDEMLSILKAAEEAKNGPDDMDDQPNDEAENGLEGNDGDEWKEVGPNNKSCVTRRHTLSKTPLADIFQGQIRSCVQHSAAEPTATLQPFFTLPLDLQLEGTSDVAQALVKNFATEPIQGFVCPTTNKEIAASRNLSLEELPPILILHMKRFVYTETSGGCQKLLKHVNVSVGLEISRDILSVNSRNKYQARQRCYKLFAVVYHKGAEATKGHYVTDVYHTGLASWLRCDDAVVRPVTESSVLNQDTNTVPYILFYRRGDTMGGNVLDKSTKTSCLS